mmetsp:Transcript_8156/g.23444  ORF Transcript_8156/g.23444 Transcript_8156/m.23444 type:complete len:236 (+) Transcript_8156:2739-3446(+)
MTDSERPILYVNVVVKDASEAVKDRVSKTLHQTPLIPNPVRKVASKHIGRAASDLTPLSHAARILSQGMCQEVPSLMKEQGIVVEVSEAFRDGPYFVLQMQVLYVNAAIMSVETEQISSCYSEWLEWFLASMGTSYQRSLESDYLPNLVHKSLANEMPKLLQAKLKENKIQAETNVLKEKAQARYFYQTLQEVQEQRAAQIKRKNSIKQLCSKIGRNRSGDNNTESTKPMDSFGD